MNGNLLTPAEIFQQAVISSKVDPVDIFNIVKVASSLTARVIGFHVSGTPKDKADFSISAWRILKDTLGADMTVPIDGIKYKHVPTSLIFGVNPDSPRSFLICMSQDFGESVSLIVALGDKDAGPCIEKLKQLFVEE